MTAITEDALEQQTLHWFTELGYHTAHGPDLAPDGASPERPTYEDTLLLHRARAALTRLNPDIPSAALEDALHRLKTPESVSLVARNRHCHRLLVDGIQVEYPTDTGLKGDLVRVVDFDDPDANDWLVVNQLTVKGPHHTRRPDLVVFLNGLPIAVFELKDPGSEQATVRAAFNQIQNYKDQIPDLFAHNELLVISDGLDARVGSLTAGTERFQPWRTIDGEEIDPPGMLALEILVRGLFERHRLLDYLRYFILYEDTTGTPVKKIAAYHQFQAVRRAVDATLDATLPARDRRCGVIWHTQGSGKSLTMAFYAAMIASHWRMQNPTLVILTDRNDLDNQLYTTFAGAAELLRQAPEQAASREALREWLERRPSGGIIFTTIQKFLPADTGERLPALSGRRNIIVIADEAHRTQYGFKARIDPKSGKMVYGLAQHLRDALPQAGFIGFTGTPLELEDKDTQAVFGDYVSIYDIQRAVEDGATVPIYYESRLARLDLDTDAMPRLDDDFEELTEDEEEAKREALKRKWSALEALVGAEPRLNKVAGDLVSHFQARQALMRDNQAGLPGKGMIVCMSRELCVRLYDALIGLHPEWHSDDPEQGCIKIIMTGTASDKPHIGKHVHAKAIKDRLAVRFKDPDDPLQLVIVRDMWLTGFDAPCLHTMYLDKPMKGHNLMQAIARVNRVFRDKPGGLVVDYLGIAHELQQALGTYTRSGGRGRTTVDTSEALALLMEKLGVCRAILHGFDYSGYRSDALGLLLGAVDHILQVDDGKKRFNDTVTAITRAMGLCGTREDALAVREEVAFFQAIKAALIKLTTRKSAQRADLTDHALRQLLSRAVVSDEVVDIFGRLEENRPDISILSDDFLAEIREMPQRNLAAELLEKLLRDEIGSRGQKNQVQAKRFSDLLTQALNKYRNRGIQTAEVIEELIRLAQDMRAAAERGETLGLNEDELAFYDALETNDSAVAVLGDEVLRKIAQELTEKVRQNVTIDWAVRENVRANFRRMVKRILRRYKYPPDKQEAAVETVIRQAELLSESWVA